MANAFCRGQLRTPCALKHLDHCLRGMWVSECMCRQVLALAHQLNPSILRRGAGEALWDELRYLLDMQVCVMPLPPCQS